MTTVDAISQNKQGNEESLKRKSQDEEGVREEEEFDARVSDDDYDDDQSSDFASRPTEEPVKPTKVKAVKPASKEKKKSSSSVPKSTLAAVADEGGNDSEKILAYLKRQNRPYSVIDVFNNLNGAVSKPNVTRVLAALFDGGLIHGKLYGKSWVYVAKQSDFPAADPKELEALDKKADQIKESISALKEEMAGLSKRSSLLSATLSTEAMEAEVTKLEGLNEEMEERLRVISSGTIKMDQKDKLRIERGLLDMRNAWKKRKKMFTDAWATISEGIPGKPKDLMEELGIETDERMMMDFKRDPLEGLL